MIGALLGDIIGSVYEHDNIKTKDFPLFSPECTFTDDSVLTLAIADCILNDLPAHDNLFKYYWLYPGLPYGGGFHDSTGPQGQKSPTTVPEYD